VRREFVLAVEDVEQHAVQLVRTARRIVFDDDVLQFAQFDVHLIVLAAENIHRIGRTLLAREQRLDIGKNRLLLVGHMALDLGGIFVEKAHDGKRYVALGAVDRLDQLAADGRQAEIEKIAVRVVQVVGQRPDRDLAGQFGSVAEIHQHIDHREECRRIDLVFGAHLGDRLVAEPQRDAEAAHHLQHGITVAHQVAHPVVARISTIFIHKHRYYFPCTKISGQGPCRNT